VQLAQAAVLDRTSATVARSDFSPIFIIFPFSPHARREYEQEKKSTLGI
jgi:hypothetical protein